MISGDPADLCCEMHPCVPRMGVQPVFVGDFNAFWRRIVSEGQFFRRSARLRIDPEREADPDRPKEKM